MGTKIHTDQLNNTIEINYPPQRIISLVPSQTELLFDLGLEKEIVGRTKFCIHPLEKCRTKPAVGGTKNFDIAKIRSLVPDLIIANKEENYKEGIEELRKDFPVWISDIKDLGDCCAMIRSVAELVDREEKGSEIATRIREAFGGLQIKRRYRVAYLIWKDPLMTIGNDTFIHHLLGLTGFDNVFADEKRYPVITGDDLKNREPELILLSSEPYPFKEKHIPEFAGYNSQAKIILVDGEMFSWHGSRLLYTANYIKDLHSDLKYN